MGAGRPPIPAKLKILNGNPGKREIPPEPIPVPGRPDVPYGLDQVGLEAWESAVVLLSDMGIITTAEGPLLELYAHACSGYRSALDAVSRTGVVLVSVGKDGQTEVKRNPFTIELHRYRDSIHKLLSDLGLTPVARARLGSLTFNKEYDPMAEFIA